MNNNTIIVFDFEAGSPSRYKCQPTQLSAIAVDPKRLTIKPNGVFNTLLRPLYFDDDEARQNGYDELQPKALELTGLTREVLATAPLLSVGWGNFVQFVDQFKIGTNKWGRPIMCGYNINNYDYFIVDRLCQMYKPYSEEDEQQALFHPVHRIDLLNDLWRWTENVKINDNNSISMDSIRDWMGIDKDKAHNAMKDVFDSGFLMVKFLKMYRALFQRIKFRDSFKAENLEIAKLMKEYDG